LLSYLACYKGIWGPHLIIVPTSCLVNWESEIKRFCPAFKVLTYYGSAKRRKELRVGWTKPNWNHIVVTSYQLAVQDAFAFRRKKWYYLILDEAHNIKNFQSQRWQTLVNFNTQRRLLLTGTPLQNNLMELWSLLHFLMPHIFRSRKEFSYWFSNPMNNIIEGNSARNDDLIGRLHGIIRPFVLRRLKKDVEQQMPGKYEHIVKCQLSRRQMFLYEEFMARSSTRLALKKGGNYMGMMNVLMQLRKVCNHPDLFEARTVVTPFFMEPLSITTAGCVINATESLRADGPSSHLLHPLWSVGCGIPSFGSALAHDEVQSDALSSLKVSSDLMLKSVTDDSIAEPTTDDTKTPGLVKLLNQIRASAKEARLDTVTLQSDINSWRCGSPAFALSKRLVDSVLLEPKLPEEAEDLAVLDVLRIASTPKELMDMRRTQQQRADAMEEVFTKFVFCVPRAGSRQPSLVASRVDTISASNEAQLIPLVSKQLGAYYHPYRTVQARLTSFFPDKKLIQYDAGKLQTLSALLYDLKRGGHRVLIFTQMSKMLDILEAFLNLHAHTYLRLDGATGVDKRQRLMDRFNNDTKVFCFILSTRSGGLGINLTGADTVIFYDR
jgi:SNF2 family DNA or RNA helicase